MNEKNEQVKLENTGEIELPKIDVKKYVGKKAKIQRVTEYKSKFGYMIKVESDILETVKGRNSDIEIRASRIFGLQTDLNGKIGWGANTILGLYLKKMGVIHYNQLVGKEITVQATLGKDENEYLTFI